MPQLDLLPGVDFPRERRLVRTSATRRLVVTFGLAGALASVSCGSSGTNRAASVPAGSDGGAALVFDDGGTLGPSLSDDATPGASDAASCAANQPGCACSTVGQSAACWTGPASERGVGACKDGVTTCQGQEFGTWGPCLGEVLDCGPEAGPPDAGVPDTGVQGEDGGPPNPTTDSCRRLALSYFLEAAPTTVCVVDATGDVHCAGTNAIPVTLSGVRCISGGENFMCVVTSAGGVECWGDTTYALASTASPPTTIAGLEAGVIDIAAGETHVCVLMSTGAVECWGGASGEVNTGSWTPPSSPTPVAGLAPGVKAITSGDGFSCAIVGSGEVQCWGNNTQGELGNGGTTESPTPVSVTGLPSPAVGVWADQATHPCALLQDGSVWCWGETGGIGGQSSSVPSQVTGFAAGVTALTTGGEESESCALLTTGGVQCWGEAEDTSLGGADGGTNSAVPVDVVNLGSGVLELRSTDADSCARMATGAVECWGYSYGGGLPIVVSGL